MSSKIKNGPITPNFTTPLLLDYAMIQIFDSSCVVDENQFTSAGLWQLPAHNAANTIIYEDVMTASVPIIRS